LFREEHVNYLPLAIPLFAFLGTTLGLIGMFLANHSHCQRRCCFGRYLYVAVFCLIAIACLTMAVTWPRGVLPCSLAIAALFLAMLWHPANPVEEA
jgi:hypothetical protein